MTNQAIDTPPQNPWLWLVLVLTLGLTVWVANQPNEQEDADLLVSNDGVPTPVIKKIAVNTSSRASMQTTKAGAWQVRHRQPLQGKPYNLFPVHGWAVTAPVQKQTQQTETPAPPTAPLAPFAYVGKIEDGPKGTMIFLMGRNKLFTTAIGENVDAMWRLDGEDANTLKFTFLPLNLPQTLLKSQPLLAPDVAATAVD